MCSILILRPGRHVAVKLFNKFGGIGGWGEAGQAAQIVSPGLLGRDCIFGSAGGRLCNIGSAVYR